MQFYYTTLVDITSATNVVFAITVFKNPITSEAKSGFYLKTNDM